MTATEVSTVGENALDLLGQTMAATLDLRAFQCLADCGRCCRYKVSLHEQDCVRLTGAGCSIDTFRDNTRSPARGYSACLARGADACVFLDGDKRCRVYEHRPLACRSYPYIRQAYTNVQLDVDLSCPGVGFGNAMDSESLTAVLRDDDEHADHAALLESHRRAMDLAMRLASGRVTFEPFEDVVGQLRLAAGQGFPTLIEKLVSLADGHGPLLPGNRAGRVRRREMEDQAMQLLTAYLLLWAHRQTLWRYVDAAAAAGLSLRSRSQAIGRFLLDICQNVCAGAAVVAAGQDAVLIGYEHVLAEIRQADSTCRTYCQQFWLEA